MNEPLQRLAWKLLLLGIAAAIYAIARTQQRSRDAGSETWRFHPLLPALAASVAAALVWAGHDMLAIAQDPDTRPLVMALFGFAVGTATTVAAYLARYRVRIDALTIEYGAFIRRCVPLAEIVDCDLGFGDRPNLLLYHRDGRRTSIPALIGEFDALVARVQAHCAQLGRAGAADPSRKAADRARRRRWRFIGWGLLAAVVLLAVAVVIIARD